ncbi:uncharacterized protein MYCFIDRAFT_76954 [Pseudocercospora fijiensis CIRAD86]|uniref:Uncharacterized protein n=1 Tax=Pseudocercospora fijiensis (strain CIRAD86) TaxID=383855 RepID=M3AU51_PSEFD|nr:uncharacterized protein MYCFIDRAFT_76954 [Pseudocercospora fijiensis CIRAD86]EME81017.1 hypothetical protein MYCFIDRAFT_76954 [Pseudocercospora fijiensis CIRAD86]
MESQQEREQPNGMQLQQQQQQPCNLFGSSSGLRSCQGPASKATVNNTSTPQAYTQPTPSPSDAFALGGFNNPIVLDPELRKPRPDQQAQEQAGVDVELPQNDGDDLPDLGTANDEVAVAAGPNDDGSRLHSQQPARPNASDLSARTQASIVHKQHLDKSYLRISPDLAEKVQELTRGKGWPHQKVWHWYYNGMPVEEAPGVANDPPVSSAPLEALESEGVYEFFDWYHYRFRRRYEGLNPRQCKIVRFSGMDVEVMLLAGNDAGQEGSKILLDHILSAKEEFPNLEELSFAECVFGPPTEASCGIKELFRTRFAHKCQLTCTGAFAWCLTFSATHRGHQGDEKPRTENFKVSITHFRAKKAFDEERAKLRLLCQELGIETVEERLCRDVVDDMDGIRHKFEHSSDFTRLMELRHVLACLSIQSTLERQIEDHKRNHKETGLVQTEPSGFHLLAIDNSKSSHAWRIFTEAMTFAETWFPRLFFTDDLRVKYGNPWTTPETIEDKEPASTTGGSQPVASDDTNSAVDTPQPYSGDGGALAPSRKLAGQDNDRSNERRSPSEGQSQKRLRSDEPSSTRPRRRRRQVGEVLILPKQPAVSKSNAERVQEASGSVPAEAQPTMPSESIREAAHSSHLAETPNRLQGQPEPGDGLLSPED